MCKNKINQQGQQAHAVEVQEQAEEKLFVATSYATSSDKGTWLIDSGCTSHMTYDVDLFTSLGKSNINKVKVANGDYVEVKGKGDIVVETPSGTKFISDVLLVPEIRQNLLSVGQMPENHYALHFKDKSCIIYDPPGNELMTENERKEFFG